MARPIKNNADYFSHDNDMRDDERIKAVRRKFSHPGYSTWNMLLERLCRAENFKVEYNENSIDIMAGDFNLEPEQLKEIIDYLIKLKLIIQEGEIIFSQTMINRFEGLFRKRKRDAERLSLPKTNDKNNIAADNAQSKVKESKVNKRKENEMKEKGNKGNQSPIFFNNFFKEENTNADTPLTEKEKNSSDSLKEKSSEEKELPMALADTEKTNTSRQSISVSSIQQCKTIFLKQSPFYAWEHKDSEQLVFILQKIVQTKKSVQTEKDLIESFSSLLQKLPEYWRTKKFTIPNLNYNYNEIVNEIRAKKQTVQGKKQIQIKPSLPKPPEIKSEPTEAEKIQIRKDFIKTICECYEKYVNKGEYGFLPKWVMYQTLVDEKVLKLTAKKLEQYKRQALENRKAELLKPQNPYEARTFRGILDNLNEEMLQGNEKTRIEIDVKNLAVQGLFEELKKKKIDIKTVLKN